MGGTSGYRKVSVQIDVPPLHKEAAVRSDRTAILVVDLQNESIHPDGEHYSTPEGMEAVHATAELIEEARTHGVRVFWLQSVRTPDQPVFSVYGMKPYRLEGTWNVEITPPLQPAPEEPIFKKYTHDVFCNTDFEPYLKEHGILGPNWTFIVTGASFTGCVHHAITGLSMRDYRVLVPMDCVSPRTGDKAMVALYRVGHRSYSFNTTPLESWRGIKFDGTNETDSRGVPT